MNEQPSSKMQVEAAVEWLASNAHNISLTDWDQKSRVLLNAAAENERLQQDLARYENGRVVMSSEIDRLRMAERLNVETVARLQKERDELKADLDHRERYWEQFDHYPKGSALPPNDVQRDAERYRTLREGNDYEHPGAMVVLCEQEHIDSDGRPFWSIAGELLDCYADRARAAETKEAPHDEHCDVNDHFIKGKPCNCRNRVPVEKESPPDPTGNWPREVFKPLPPDEAKLLRDYGVDDSADAAETTPAQETTNWWVCPECKSRNHPDYHRISCPGCSKLRPAPSEPASPK